jgi:hypothetical protein
MDASRTGIGDFNKGVAGQAALNVKIPSLDVWLRRVSIQEKQSLSEVCQ